MKTLREVNIVRNGDMKQVHVIVFPGDEVFLKVYYGRSEKEQKCYSIYRYGVLNQENAQGNEDPECFMSESTGDIDD